MWKIVFANLLKIEKQELDSRIMQVFPALVNTLLINLWLNYSLKSF